MPSENDIVVDMPLKDWELTLQCCKNYKAHLLRIKSKDSERIQNLTELISQLEKAIAEEKRKIN